MLKRQTSVLLRCACCAAALLVGGCVLSPHGTKAESDRVRDAGRSYEQLPARRELPPLPEHPDEQDVVDRVMLADGNLEAAYFQWAAAMQRVIEAGTYPGTNVSLGLSYMLNGGGSAWNRTTVQISPDSMRSLDWPVEVSTAAKAALAQAKAAGADYAAMRRQVRRDAVNAWLDYALNAEELRLQKQDVDLLKLAEESAQAAVAGGGDLQPLLDARIASAQGRQKLHELESTLQDLRAKLNAMMHRPVEASLLPPAKLPAAAPMNLTDAQVLTLAARNDPQLASLVHAVAGQSQTIEQAKLQYLPDVNPMFAFTGNISQMIGAGLSTPLDRLPAIKAMVRQAHDQWRAAMAQLEQKRYDRGAEVVAALVMMRHQEYTARLFAEQVLPAATEAVQSLGQNYAAGNASLRQMIDAERAVLAVRQTIAEARIGRAKSLADLQAIIAEDNWTEVKP